MREFLKFKSVGGGTLAVSVPGDFYLPIDNILICQRGGTGIQIWQNAVSNQDGGNVRYYDIDTSDVSLNDATVVAINQALAANPGGKSIEVQLPVGQTITSWDPATSGIV